MVKTHKDKTNEEEISSLPQKIQSNDNKDDLKPQK